MRIALLADYYAQYLRAFHERHQTELGPLDYHGHQERLFADYFGSFISYRNHFRQLGHECELFLGNYYPLQQKWLAQRGDNFPAAPANKQAVVLRQLRDFQPEVFFIGSMFDYYGAFLREVARITPNIFAWIACPHPRNLDFAPVRCVVSSVPDFVDAFRRQGVRAERLKAAFDLELLPLLGRTERDVGLSFVGGLSWSHRDRMELLEALLRTGLPLEAWGYRATDNLRARLRTWWRGSPIDACHRGEVWGLEMYRVLARSRLTVNVHIDIARTHQTGGNMRLYEATGCGALLITDHAPDVPGLFEPGKEIVTYQSNDDLIAKAGYFLDHPAEAEAIAQAGQQACWKRHGYVERIREFEQIIKKHAA